MQYKAFLYLIVLQVISLQAEALFQPATEASIRLKNMAKKYDIALGFGDMGTFTILNAGVGGSATFTIMPDRENKEREYITLNLKAYGAAGNGDARRKVLERKSMRIYAPIGLLGSFNSSENELHLDYNQHSRNGNNIGNFKVKFKPDIINKKIEIEQLFSANV